MWGKDSVNLGKFWFIFPIILTKSFCNPFFLCSFAQEKLLDRMKTSLTFKIWTIAWLMLCYTIYTEAKPTCNVTRYDENSGLSQWRITQMVQDYSDLMWFATWNGLNRFDGYEFKCYKVSQDPNCRMTDDRIRNIWLSDDGNIYCKSDEGYYLFNTKTYTYEDIVGESKETLEKKLLSKYKGFWIDKMENGNLHHRDGSGNEWVLTHEGELSYKDKQTNCMKPYPLDVPMENLKFCYADRQGNLWILFVGGVYKLTFTDNSIEHLPQDYPTHVRCVFVDPQNRYWVTGRDDASVRIFHADNTLMGYLGPDGRIHSKPTYFEAPIYCITRTSTGSIWMGSKPGGLYRLDEETDRSYRITHYKHNYNNPYSLSHNDVYDIQEDKQGRLWIATLGGGINCMTDTHGEGHFIHYLNDMGGYPEGFCKKVRRIFITPAGDILMAATNEGLLVCEMPQKEKDFPSMNFRHHMKVHNDPKSLSSRAIMDILQDSHGNIFISTENGGINQLTSRNLLNERLEFKHFNASNNLPSDITLRMIEHDGSLWVVCTNQICVINPYEDIVSNFDNYFFGRDCRFSEAQPTELPNGRWLFGLHDGAFTLKAENLKKSEYVPPIILTGISILDNPKQENSLHGDTLILNPKQRNVTIHFAAIDYTNAAQIDYAFKLDKDINVWSKADKSRSATFLDMTPGEHMLEICSTNADGVWMDNVRRLTIIVTPTFWETGWATLLWIVLALTVAGIIVYTYIYIQRINRKQRETLESYLALLDHTEDYMGTTKEKTEQQPILNDEDELFMKQVMAFVEQHIADADTNIGDMATATATSRSSLNRKMKNILGMTPLDFLREARIKKACQMLEAGKLNISEVAYRCGFSDPKYFSRCFKQSMGVSPTDYKKK